MQRKLVWSKLKKCNNKVLRLVSIETKPRNIMDIM